MLKISGRTDENIDNRNASLYNVSHNRNENIVREELRKADIKMVTMKEV
jgi:hypothetical protein